MAKRSSAGKDPERSSAMKGNQNAKGGSAPKADGKGTDKFGMRTGVIGTVMSGLVGAAGGGVIAGAVGTKRMQDRQAKGAGIVGKVVGGLTGVAASPYTAAAGAAVGAAAGREIAARAAGGLSGTLIKHGLKSAGSLGTAGALVGAAVAAGGAGYALYKGNGALSRGAARGGQWLGKKIK
jgi:hypothetical protein